MNAQAMNDSWALDTTGAWLFARYAYAPNKLGYCGPVRSQLLLDYGATGTTDTDLHTLAREFRGAWPYLEIMAELTGVGDPLDRRIVESYWLGGGVAADVDAQAFGEALLARIKLEAGHHWTHLSSEILDGVAPNHCFHVFGVYPWSRLLSPEHDEQPLHVLDNCRIRWGTVVARKGDALLVDTRRLAWDGAALGLSAPRQERVTLAVDGRSFLPDVTPGEQVALHWDWVCDRLSDQQVATLRATTLAQIEATNRRLAPAAPLPARARTLVHESGGHRSRRGQTRIVQDADWLAAHLRAMVAASPAAWAGSDMTLHQLSALHLISAHAPVTLTALAETLGTGPPATCAMVDRLVRAGLVSRTRARQDRRRVLLSVTGDAEKMIGDTAPDTADRLQRALNGMSPAAVRCLTDVLRDIAGRLAN
ncbi:MAG: DUF6390 family protein [Pseudonocardiaceae bacterium]